MVFQSHDQGGLAASWSFYISLGSLGRDAQARCWRYSIFEPMKESAELF